MLLALSCLSTSANLNIALSVSVSQIVASGEWDNILVQNLPRASSSENSPNFSDESQLVLQYPDYFKLSGDDLLYNILQGKSQLKFGFPTQPKQFL